MKEQEALNIILKFMPAFQKFRSNVRETFEKAGAKPGDLPALEKYIFGELNPLIFCEKIADKNSITPMEFYNICTLIHRWIPEFIAVEGLWKVSIPEPNLEIISKGWSKQLD